MEAIIEGVITGLIVLISCWVGYGYNWEKKEGKKRGIYL